jgi:hypothetical protein
MLNSSQIVFTGVISDVTLVFLAVLGVSIVLFGFRKLLSLTNVKNDFDYSSGGGSYYQNGKKIDY